MSTRRPKSVLDQDRYTAELSTGQLVIGVCILLMFGLGCFLLGVLIGKFDPTLQPDSVQRADNPRVETSPPEIKVSELPPSPAATTTSPASEPVLPPEMRAPANMIKEDPAPAPATTSPSTGAAEPPPPPAETTPLATSAAAPQEPSVSESVAAAAERNRIAPPTAQPQAVETKPADTPPAPVATSTPAPAESTATLMPWKGYGVQIVAVAKDRAEGVRKDLESKSSYKARVLPHARNDLYRVVVGPYADQPAATRARDDLRARGFRDAFVLTLQ